MTAGAGLPLMRPAGGMDMLKFFFCADSFAVSLHCSGQWAAGSFPDGADGDLVLKMLTVLCFFLSGQEGLSFGIRYIHSVAKSPVEDWFRVSQQTIFWKNGLSGFGAGLPHTPGPGQTGIHRRRAHCNQRLSQGRCLLLMCAWGALRSMPLLLPLEDAAEEKSARHDARFLWRNWLRRAA